MSCLRRSSLLMLASLVCAVPTAGAQGADPLCTVGRYELVTLSLQPAAINDSGQIAGTRNRLAVVWTAPAEVRELPLPPIFSSSEANSINASGHVAFTAYGRSLTLHQSFLFKADAIALLPGKQTRAFHISDSDQIAGAALAAGQARTEPVLWIHGMLHALGGCCGGIAQSINSGGEAIGDAYDDRGRYHAFSWTEAHGLQRIGPPDIFSSAVAINDRGHVVIQGFPGVFFYVDGVSMRLTLPTKFPVHPHALNNCDVMVGSFGPVAEANRAFVWDPTRGFQDLNTLIATDSSLKLVSALGINNRGQIVGKGVTNRSESMGFLLLPKK